ncbi:asparagine synthase (glutamine-hydrolyzing) [Salinibacter ruber]|uniref:asparagine synthase (glutamine-hydrolyzing) n=1 Tax=Salinibacter ruber TaxID=146919 RepID=UPI0021677DAC|nr:asparagine synthase (glutamine-hydrolyzing) [Salinibacter ruber]MCS3642394.1 asparagine synthase (glutamine-hydrolyzing) [Salinibacter ruber]
MSESSADRKSLLPPLNYFAYASEEMSGIAGVLPSSNLGSIRRAVRVMTESLSHRGPDGRAVWVREKKDVALGHVLLTTTPESELESQPFRLESPELTLVADLRVDNREELIRALHLARHDSSSLTDPRLLAYAYAQWGIDCVDYIVGDYAFAIWDEKHNSLFCARDPMGVKPFYYARLNSGFAFASETRALLPLSGVSDSINKPHVFAFLAGSYGRRAETFFADIESLKPGHRIRVSPDSSVSSERYWNPAKCVKGEDHDGGEYDDGLRDVLQEAVDSQLRSSGGIGVLLSGGMDSSAAAVLADACTGRSDSPVHTFSTVYPSLPEHKKRLADERKYIEAVLQEGDFVSHFLRGDEVSPLQKLQEIVEIWGQPFNLRSHYTNYETLKRAHGRGVQSLMDGAEGDVVVGYGYDFFTELAIENKWGKFEEMALRYSRNCRKAGRKYPPEKAFWDHGLKIILQRACEGDLEGFYRGASQASKILDLSWYDICKQSIKQIWPDRWKEKIRAFRGDHINIVPSGKLHDLGLQKEQRPPANKPVSARRARILKTNRMLTDALEAIDPIYAAHHIEARHPFYDRRVIEYCLSIPAKQRIQGGRTRSILRRALQDVLPNKVEGRFGKAKQGVATAHSLLQFEQERLTDLVMDDVLHPFVDPETVTGLLEQFQKSKCSEHFPSCISPLLRMAVLSTWLQKRKQGKLEGKLESDGVSQKSRDDLWEGSRQSRTE